jgi:hypothetical protein
MGDKKREGGSMNENKIPWEEFSKYVSLEPKKETVLCLKNWRVEIQKYNGEERLKLTFDCTEIDGAALIRPKIFSVGGGNALKFQNIIENCERIGKKYILVFCVLDSQKKLSVIEFNEKTLLSR